MAGVAFDAAGGVWFADFTQHLAKGPVSTHLKATMRRRLRA